MVFSNNLLLAAASTGGVTPATGVITNSCRFDDDSSANLYWTPSSAASSSRKTTISLWFKLCNLGIDRYLLSAGTSAADSIQLDTSNQLNFLLNDGSNGNLKTTQVFRDPGAWYHLVVSIDTDQSTDADKIRIYLNGTQITAFATETYPSTGYDMSYLCQNGIIQYISRYNGGSYFDGYQAETVVLDGQRLDATSFGETNADGVWVPISPSALTFGTNGWWLDYEDNSTATALGNDVSGNSNDFSAGGLATTDQMPDTPSDDADNDKGNYAVLNSVQEVWGAAVTLSNGNLTALGTSSTSYNNIECTISVSSGKWVFAATQNALRNGECGLFIVNETTREARTDNLEGASGAWLCYMNTSSDFLEYDEGTSTTHTMSPVGTISDYILCAVDCDNKKIWFGRYDESAGVTEWADNGTGWTGDPTDGGTTANATLTGSQWFPGCYNYTGRGGTIDFGSGSYLNNITIPTDYKRLCTAHLTAPTITDPSEFCDVSLWTGTDAAKNIPLVEAGSGDDVSPDLVWIKERDGTSDHNLTDSVRGATLALHTNSSSSHVTTDTEGLTAFDASGFTIGDGSDSGYNTASNLYVGWSWVESTTPSFDIALYTGGGSAGDTVSHNLGVVPEFIIVFNILGEGVNQPYPVQHVAKGADWDVAISDASAFTESDRMWNDTEPTTTVFTLGNDNANNRSGVSYVSYLWASVDGFSKFGKYTGNENSDGPFVWTGFRPAMVLIKTITAGSDWYLFDDQRDPYNVVGLQLKPNSDSAEPASQNVMDFLSNGFKLRQSDNAYSNTGGMAYCAWARNPFGGSGVAQARAR